MDKKKLFKILRQDEGAKLDFKERISLNSDYDKKEFAKDICAIANSRGGRGYLIVGIQDKSKKIVGVLEENILTEERVQQIISSRCDPPIPIALENIKVNKKMIIVITIFDGEQKPYQLKDTGAFYIRRGSTNDFMRKSEILNIFQEKLDIDIETCPIVNSTIDMLDKELIKKYFNSKGIKINDFNKNFLLSSSNIIKRDTATNEERCTLGALLVFSHLNNLLVPYNMIKIHTDYKGGDGVFIAGSLLDMIDKASLYIEKNLPEDYPYDAVIEALKNAVLYRDYTLNNYIEITINNREVIVKNPGRFIENNLTYTLDYSKRNMWIYEKLITLDDKNRFIKDGNGFKRMRDKFKEIGDVKIVDDKEQMTVKVIFPGFLKN